MNGIITGLSTFAGVMIASNGSIVLGVLVALVGGVFAGYNIGKEQ